MWLPVTMWLAGLEETNLKVRIHYFGQLRQITDKDKEDVEFEHEDTIKSILLNRAKVYKTDFQNILLDEKGDIRPSVMVLLNGTMVSRDKMPTFKDGDEITVLTAIAGG